MTYRTLVSVTLLTAMTAGTAAQDAPANLPAPATPAWIENVKLSGDVRLLHEQTDDASRDDTRTRGRMRVRLGVDGRIADDILARLRLATGGGNPVSRSQTFTDAFSSKDFGIDLAYLRYQPNQDLQLHIYGGKMPTPFMTVADLVWDGDVHPEGAATTLAQPLGAVTLLLNAGAFWVEEDAVSDSRDRHLGTAQAALQMPLGGAKLLVGAGVYAFTAIEGGGLLVDPARGFGNTTRNVGTAEAPELVYASDFTQLELFAELDGKVRNIPLALYGQYVQNTDADSDNTGYLVGGTAGTSAAPGAVAFGYNYRRLEKDAVLGALTDLDFVGGGTDGEGHKLTIAVGLAQNVQLGGRLFLSAKDPDGQDTDYTRWILDLTAKF